MTRSAERLIVVGGSVPNSVRQRARSRPAPRHRPRGDRGVLIPGARTRWSRISAAWRLQVRQGTVWKRMATGASRVLRPGAPGSGGPTRVTRGHRSPRRDRDDTTDPTGLGRDRRRSRLGISHRRDEVGRTRAWLRDRAVLLDSDSSSSPTSKGTRSDQSIPGDVEDSKTAWVRTSSSTCIAASTLPERGPARHVTSITRSLRPQPSTNRPLGNLRPAMLKKESKSRS